MGAMSKVRGSTKNQAYPQTEVYNNCKFMYKFSLNQGMLADTMTKYGKVMGNQSDFGKVIFSMYEWRYILPYLFLGPLRYGRCISSNGGCKIST
jgi:hypothetical protein